MRSQGGRRRGRRERQSKNGDVDFSGRPDQLVGGQMRHFPRIFLRIVAHLHPAHPSMLELLEMPSRRSCFKGAGAEYRRFESNAFPPLRSRILLRRDRRGGVCNLRRLDRSAAGRAERDGAAGEDPGERYASSSAASAAGEEVRRHVRDGRGLPELVSRSAERTAELLRRDEEVLEGSSCRVPEAGRRRAAAGVLIARARAKSFGQKSEASDRGVRGFRAQPMRREGGGQGALRTGQTRICVVS